MALLIVRFLGKSYSKVLTQLFEGAGVGAAMRMASPKGPGSLDVFKVLKIAFQHQLVLLTTCIC